MKKIFLFMIIFSIAFASVCFAQGNRHKHQGQSGFDHSWGNDKTYMRPYRPNAYGPGIHSDSTGRPFQWETEDGQISNGRVKTDGYGLGVGRDEYGRPVKPKAFGE